MPGTAPPPTTVCGRANYTAMLYFEIIMITLLHF